MFGYYGSKSKIVKYYPRPQYDSIIEPFAGSARYSLMYFERDITLVDKYKTICEIWEYLKNATPKEILSLSNLNVGDDLRLLNQISGVEKKFISFIIASGNISGNRNIVTKMRPPLTIKKQLALIAKNLFKIKHWKIINDCYKNLQNSECTWFIDPPYQYGGEHYVESNKNIDFKFLSQWCRSRNGQVIVCENIKATWMPFVPLKSMRGVKHTTIEAIWTKDSNNQIKYKENNLFGL